MNMEKTLEEFVSGIASMTGGMDERYDPDSQLSFDDDAKGGYVISGTFRRDGGKQEALSEELFSAMGGNRFNVVADGITGSIEGGSRFDVVTDGISGAVEEFVNYSPSVMGGGYESSIVAGANKKQKELCSKYTSYKVEIQDSIANLMLLKQFLAQGYEKLYELIEKSDARHEIEIGAIQDVHQRVLSEVDNQLDTLRKLLDVTINPTQKELASALTKFSDFDKVAQLLMPYDYNTSEASDRLALAYSGVFQIKRNAAKVQKALDTVKMTLSEYSSTNNMNDLTNKLIKSFKTSNVDLKNLIEAMGILKNNFQNKKAIADFVKDPKKMDVGNFKRKGGEEGGLNKTELGRIPSQDTGLSKRIKSSKTTLKELFKLFMYDVNQKYDEIKKSADVISSNIGHDIDYNENLTNFLDAYENLGELSNRNIYYSLIGMRRSSADKQAKQIFLDNLTLISNTLTSLKTGKYGNYFRDIQNNINNLIVTIDTYTDMLEHSKTVVHTKSGGDDDDKIVNDLFEENKLINDSVLISSTNVVKETVNKLKFYGNLIAMKQNLKASSTQFKLYKENYANLLGKTIGNKLTLLNDDYLQTIKAIENKGPDGKTTKIGEALKSDDDKKAKVKSFVKLQFEAREGLYKTIEAVDTYLMNFTENIVANPEEVNEIQKMLNSVQVITKWYSNQSGNDLVALFELFNSNTAQDPIDKILEGKPVETKDGLTGYGADIAAQMKDLHIDIDHVEKILQKCKKSLEGVSVLKNLISTFTYVGDRFKNTSVKDSLFMSPNVIYKHLFKYLWISAFQVHFYDADNAANLTELAMVVHKPLTVQLPRPAGVVDTPTIVDGISENKHDIFQTDDEYFILLLKSMIAKIYTVVGTFSLQKDPTNIKSLVQNKTRLILGGANNVQIIDEAMELYIRLPLLVEFYRGVFDDSNKTSRGELDNAKKSEEIVAFLPEVGSVWSNLISIIFDKSKHIENDIYTTNNLNSIISEINKIYKYYSSTKDSRVVINGLINEINKRYGILKRKDINSYYSLIEKYQGTATGEDVTIDNNLNFDILDEDNEYDLPAPSNQYTKTAYSSELLKAKRQMVDDRKMIETFRKNIDEQLTFDNDLDDVSVKSFKQFIKLFKEELKASTSNDKKYEIVVKAIQKSNQSTNSNKSHYILFHELVVAPLNILSYFNEITKKFLTDFKLEGGDAAGAAKAFDLLNHFANVDTNGLIKLKFVSDVGLLVDYSNFQEIIENLIENIKYMLQKFNVIINKSNIDSNRSELYKLEDSLLVKMILNKNNKDGLSLEKLAVSLNNVSTHIKNPEIKVLIASKILYKTNVPNVEQTTLHKDMYKTYNTQSKMWEPLTNIGTVGVSLSNDSSMVNQLNHLITTYLVSFYNISNKKIYSNLLSTFNQTMITLLLNDRLGFKDHAGTTSFLTISGTPVTLKVGDNKSILSASVSYMVTTLLTRDLNPQLSNKIHLVDEFSSVSPHIIERYRSQLPILIKLFTLLIKKCLYYKQLYVENMTEDGVGQTQKANSSIVLDGIIECCNSILTDANNVLNEVHQLDNNATSLFMELKQNFIRNYYNTTSATPFMPLSALTMILDPSSIDTLVPKHNNTSDHLKYQYGIKDILNGNSEFTLKNMTYVNELCKTYNSSVNNAHNIDDSNVNKIISNQLTLLKTLTTMRYSNYLSDAANVLAPPQALKTSYFSDYTKLPIYINNIENSIRESSINALYTFLNATSADTSILALSRKQARKLNIVELNIVPINVHALLREVPLINVYNYAFTFDNYVNETLSGGDATVVALRQSLLNPHQSYPVSAEYNKTLTGSIPQLKLYQPRFLSDQIAKKVLVVPGRKDTKIVQNLVFLSNLQRVLRVHIKASLDTINTKIVEKIKLTSEQITDYTGTQTSYNDNEFEMASNV